MKSYYYSNLFFKKKWIWFSDPKDVGDADVVTFFSYNDLPVLGFTKKEGWTSVIDLSKSLEELWQAMRQSFIGEQIKKGERKGIVVKQDDNFFGFYDLYTKFREKKGIPKDDEKVFKKYGLFFSAYLGSDLLASGVFITDEENIRAWALSSKRLEGVSGPMKDLIGQANRMIIWEAIKYGKTKNLKRFDFGGIDIFKDGSTPSLTAFKEAFGGIRVKNYYYTKVYSKILKFVRKIKFSLGHIPAVSRSFVRQLADRQGIRRGIGVNFVVEESAPPTHTIPADSSSLQGGRGILRNHNKKSN